MKIKIALIIIYLSSILIDCRTQTAPTYSDVYYTSSNSIKQSMDIYIPTGITKPVPCIIFIHGGGWATGSKGISNIVYFTQSFKAGWVCVDFNYRLSGDSLWPAQLYDCKAAIRFLKANASKYKIDTCSIGIIGTSAGGHLVAMLGTTGGVKKLEGRHLGNTHVSSRVHAVIDLYGPTDFLKMDGHYYSPCTAPLFHNSNSAETKVLGCDFLTNCVEKVASANPINYITSDDPPFMIIHGDKDCSVPTYQSILLDSVLKVKGMIDTFILAKGMGHGGNYFTAATTQLMYHNFYKKYFKTCIISDQRISYEDKLMIFPNPVKDKIYIRGINGNVKYNLYSLLGERVLTGFTSGFIDVSKLRKALYFLELNYDSNKICRKIVIE